MRARVSICASLILILVATILGPFSASRPTLAEVGPKAPNILIIVTDDQRSGFSVMPATRRIFRRHGRSFSNAFVTTPLCCPSRGSIFTGKYAHNHGIINVNDYKKLDHSLTMQRYLQDAGYQTAAFGKFLNHWKAYQRPPFFDRWAVLGSGPGRGYRHGRWNINGRVKRVNRYSTNFIKDKALAFLENSSGPGDEPWFMHVGTPAPHSPFTPAPRYAHSRVGTWFGGAGVRESDLSDKPGFIRTRRRVGASEGRDIRRAQFRTLMSVDDLVRALFRKLKAMGEARNTLAIFTSDNGYLWGEHGLQGKRRPYTEAISVPLMVRWPGHVKPGTNRSRLVANIDLFPTVLRAARIDGSAWPRIDGRALWDSKPRRRLLTEYSLPGQEEYGFLPSWASTRTKRYQYIESYKPSGRIRFREYYRLSSDSAQRRNLLHDGRPGNNPHVRRLHRRLASDRRCAGTACP